MLRNPTGLPEAWCLKKLTFISERNKRRRWEKVGRKWNRRAREDGDGADKMKSRERERRAESQSTKYRSAAEDGGVRNTDGADRVCFLLLHFFPSRGHTKTKLTTPLIGLLSITAVNRCTGRWQQMEGPSLSLTLSRSVSSHSRFSLTASIPDVPTGLLPYFLVSLFSPRFHLHSLHNLQNPNTASSSGQKKNCSTLSDSENAYGSVLTRARRLIWRDAAFTPPSPASTCPSLCP